MQIQLACPAPARTLYGNRITALRWARILRDLGHRPAIVTDYDGRPCDLLIALHARRSAPAVFRFRDRYPERPILVALTGTDLYQDIRRDRDAQKALELASRLILLQPLGIDELRPDLRAKARVIYQSVPPTPGRGGHARHSFDVAIVGHLRAVKDPFRAALATRMLPRASRVRLLHAGTAMDKRMEARARAEEQRNPRYRWLGGIPRWRARRLIASSRLVVLSSRMEGGANVISEAVVDRVPVLASRIPGSVGLLGADYPGYFPAGDTRGLRDLLWRAETDAGFYRELKSWCARLAPRFRPERERAAWKELLRACV